MKWVISILLSLTVMACTAKRVYMKNCDPQGGPIFLCDPMD